jgi:hypothetical protein
VKYKISVKTGDVRGAGTDANVFVKLFGESGETEDKKLESSGNNFERGNTDTFSFEALDLGEVTKVRVGHGKFFLVLLFWFVVFFSSCFNCLRCDY